MIQLKNRRQNEKTKTHKLIHIWFISSINLNDSHRISSRSCLAICSNRFCSLVRGLHLEMDQRQTNKIKGIKKMKYIILLLALLFLSGCANECKEKEACVTGCVLKGQYNNTGFAPMERNETGFQKIILCENICESYIKSGIEINLPE